MSVELANANILKEAEARANEETTLLTDNEPQQPLTQLGNANQHHRTAADERAIHRQDAKAINREVEDKLNAVKHDLHQKSTPAFIATNAEHKLERALEDATDGIIYALESIAIAAQQPDKLLLPNKVDDNMAKTHAEHLEKRRQEDNYLQSQHQAHLKSTPAVLVTELTRTVTRVTEDLGDAITYVAAKVVDDLQ